MKSSVSVPAPVSTHRALTLRPPHPCPLPHAMGEREGNMTAKSQCSAPRAAENKNLAAASPGGASYSIALRYESPLIGAKVAGLCLRAVSPERTRPRLTSGKSSCYGLRQCPRSTKQMLKVSSHNSIWKNPIARWRTIGFRCGMAVSCRCGPSSIRRK